MPWWLVTEWKQFRQPDFQKIRGSMRTPLLVDGRNLYAPARMAELGFIYQGSRTSKGRAL
ncbi:nucleotide sugar dehydrogenase [Pseudomonas aeruginosa]|nr:nucleotide sugar dehydrogenase [Pseudomonas aeruginosa]